jgi:hypothetical protein
LYLGCPTVKLRDHARDSLLAERYQHPPSHYRRHPVRDTVGKHGVERTGYGYIAEFRHTVDRNGVTEAR